MALVARLRIGEKNGEYGMWASPVGKDVLKISDSAMLFSSNENSLAFLAHGFVDLRLGKTTTVNFTALDAAPIVMLQFANKIDASGRKTIELPPFHPFSDQFNPPPRYRVNVGKSSFQAKDLTKISVDSLYLRYFILRESIKGVPFDDDDNNG